MSKRQILMILGAWVMILPSSLLGLPGWLKAILGVITGLAIIFVAYRAKSASEPRAATPVDSYVERRSEPAAPQAEITSTDQKAAS